MKPGGLRYLFLFLPFCSLAQNGTTHYGFYNLTSFSGAAQIHGSYRNQDIIAYDQKESEQSSLFGGGILLNTSGFFWHPSFLAVDLGVEYNPETSQDNYLIIPDQAEVRTLKKLDLRTTFFQQRPIVLSAFLNLDESYNNRENLSNIKSNSMMTGASLGFTNRILPLTIDYREGWWKQEEIQTGRIYENDYRNINAKLNKSFSRHDRHELLFSHNEYASKDNYYYDVSNTSDNFNFSGYLTFDSSGDYRLNSLVSGTRQYGSDDFTRFQVNENITIRLPARFTVTGGYDFYNTVRDFQELNQHMGNLYINHRLYESLYTGLIFEYSDARHTFYEETTRRAGFDIKYEKKIPGGRLTLGYKYLGQHQNHTGEPVPIRISNEAHVLKDGEIVLLDKPYVELSTVLVTDLTGTMVFQLNFDYILIERNSFIEIQRVPGGNIPNGGAILISYVTIQPSSYSYNSTTGIFDASILILNRLLEFYYRHAQQDYSDVTESEFLTLNYYTQNIYGVRIDYRFLSAGAEYDDYRSSLLPYRLSRYFLTLQGSFKNRLLYSLNTGYRDYQLLADQTDQQYLDIAGQLSYTLSRSAKFIIEGGYRNQRGEQIDLDLLTARMEVTATLNKLFFTVGMEFYRRLYIGDTVNFNGIYARILRRF